MFKIDENFQTLPVVAKHMAEMAKRIKAFHIDLIGLPYCSVLEPTPGKGNLVSALNDAGGFVVYGPGSGDFWESWVNTHKYAYHFVVMNPPFNPFKETERFVRRSMELSENVIALLPWSYITNSERRLADLMAYGLVSITHLPRKTFSGCRVQVAIFELKKGYAGATQLKRFTW